MENACNFRKLSAFCLCCITVVCFCLAARGQKITPDLTENNKVWDEVFIYCWPYPTHYFTNTFKLGTDTTCLGRPYTEILHSDSYDHIQGSGTCIGYLRQDGQKTYFIKTDDFLSGNFLKEGLIYDFGVNVGDTIHVYNSYYCPDTLQKVVIAIDSVFVYDGFYKRIHLPLNEEWIEGVGSTAGLLFSGACFAGSIYELLCFSENDTVKFTNPVYSDCNVDYYSVEQKDETVPYRVTPNPAGDFIIINTGGQKYFDVKVNSLDGKTTIVKRMCRDGVSIDITDLPRGIFIIEILEDNTRYITKVAKR